MTGCRSLAHRQAISAAMQKPRKTHYVEEDRGYETPCWVWQLRTNAKGYPQVSITRMGEKPMQQTKRSYRAHRVYYERRHGPIPPGLTIDHLCEQRNCVNPDHMEAVTQKENVRRGLARRAAKGLPRYSR